MLFLTNGFICLFYENKFMLISGGHISNRSIRKLVKGGTKTVGNTSFETCLYHRKKKWHGSGHFWDHRRLWSQKGYVSFTPEKLSGPFQFLFETGGVPKCDVIILQTFPFKPRREIETVVYKILNH